MKEKIKKKLIQQLLIDNSPPNSDNEVHPAEQDPLTQSALSLIPNSYLNRLDYGKVEKLVENINTQKREDIKERLMFGEILSRSVGEGYKCLRKKDKKEFSNVVITEKEKFKKYKLLTQTKIFTVRDKKENKTAKNENLKEQLILEYLTMRR
ncbi:unnamed protein product [Parnassius apollo]|uniref:(apollo) hypothetical protein n=1 Tax=Parnassius apollo TaxID=110799 RepID=A0A8S3YAA9_PARAO|nr:unnamed protein product [Parnassius apollo]